MHMSWQGRLLTWIFRMQHTFSRTDGEVDLVKERTELDKLGSMFRTSTTIHCEQEHAGGVPAEWITTPDSVAHRVVLYLHGGSFVSGSIKSHRSLAANIAHAAKARALVIDYRLAPEHPFPAALDDALAAYSWLSAHHAAPYRVTIAGDSAGGGLVVALLIKLRDLGMPMPAAAVCLSPMTDHTYSGETWKTNARADIVIYPKKEHVFTRMYLGGADPHDPLVSPHYADLAGLPPLLIQVGTHEVLLSDSRCLAQRARAAGVDVTLDEWEGMQHVWQFGARFIPEGREAIARIGGFILKVSSM
jgi:acetyl esterase/lipase